MTPLSSGGGKGSQAPFAARSRQTTATMTAANPCVESRQRLGPLHRVIIENEFYHDRGILGFRRNGNF